MHIGVRLFGAALLAVCSISASAQSPGSVESELKYAREYMDAGKWDYAMWRYEAILARDPNNAEAKAGYARAKAAREGGNAPQPAFNGGNRPPPGPAPRPNPRPAPDPQPNAGRLKVGDYVEFDRFSDGSWGRFGRIVKLNGSPDSPCPSYFVEETGGVTISYVCGRVRPAKGPVPPVRDDAKGAPPTGSYFCTYGLNRGQVLGPGRNFRLMAGGRYAADDGETGTYSYNAGTGRISFRGGFFGRMNAYGEYKGGRSSQIDINPAGGVVSFCSRQ